MTSIWDLQIKISNRLLIWSGLSILTGVILLFSDDPLWKGFGIQATIWGAIDGGIAIVGRFNTRKKLSTAMSPEQLAKEAKKLRSILLLNTGLDVLYIVFGILLAFTLSSKSFFWQGNGYGIILQGIFLFFFDLIHAQIVPTGGVFTNMQAFQEPEHLPFLLQSGRPAALLVHGFPGTPAEMRSLGESLSKAGWTAQGILLPGFGPEIATLGERNFEEWVDAIDKALTELKHEHSPVLLVGYSMGGALSIIESSRHSPDGLILLAPFWWSQSILQSIILILRPFLPRYFQPFNKADFTDLKVRNGIKNFMPQANLDDPAVQDEIRQIKVTSSMFAKLHKMSKLVYKNAESVKMPLLVIQGRQDKVVIPELTKRLLKRFPDQRLQYLEVDAEHDLTNTSNPAWIDIENAVLNFAESLKSLTE
jgi:carboxylesterase